ncbi:hypothetical protein TNCT_35551 [Trichonephila clavata]|uniref:Uncharacterized protein n=1 Tax=Trichonephila clavata TaxID=2740835 RepID=A0A8X6GY58_TRICU|nr:hypothetical protein TNCT_35551 [Trichonephila clavata]
MISETLVNALKDLPFPHKLYILASNPGIRSIRWAHDGFTIKLSMNIMKRELVNPLLLNVRKFDDLIPVLFDYNFRRINSQKK